MKKTGEIVGLPIVSLADGGEVGRVRSLVIDAKNATIAAVTVDDGQWYKDAKLIAFADILGIGVSALTIEQKASIKPLSQVGELEKLLEADVNVLGTKVLSKKGQILGEIAEVYFNEETGKIAECFAKGENGNDFTINATNLYTLASNMTVVSDGSQQASSAATAAQAPQAQVQSTPVKPAEPETKAETPAATGEAETTNANEAMQKFEERQKKFLLGKKATRKISTDNGVVIVEQGEEVTEEILQKAKLSGKFVELSMSLQ